MEEKIKACYIVLVGDKNIQHYKNAIKRLKFLKGMAEQIRRVNIPNFKPNIEKEPADDAISIIEKYNTFDSAFRPEEVFKEYEIMEE